MKRSSVCRAGMISTSRIKGAGLKKWMPRIRSGWRIWAPMAEIDKDDVLLAIIVSSFTVASMLLKAICLGSTSSRIASMTTAHSLKSLMWSVYRMRAEQRVRIAVGHFAFFHQYAQGFLDSFTGFAEGRGQVVAYHHIVPAGGGYLGNTTAHCAGAKYANNFHILLLIEGFALFFHQPVV
jgi:hypothetical protein